MNIWDIKKCPGNFHIWLKGFSRGLGNSWYCGIVHFVSWCGLLGLLPSRIGHLVASRTIWHWKGADCWQEDNLVGWTCLVSQEPSANAKWGTLKNWWACILAPWFLDVYFPSGWGWKVIAGQYKWAMGARGTSCLATYSLPSFKNEFGTNSIYLAFTNVILVKMSTTISLLCLALAG